MPRKYIEGADKAERFFRGSSAKMAEKIAIALNKGGAEVKAAAKIMAPVQPGPSGGDLRDDIHAEPIAVQAAKANRGKGNRGGRQHALVVLVTAATKAENAHAAYRTEFGRAPGPGSHPGITAQHWFYNSYWSLRKRVQGRIKRAVKAAAKDMVSRGKS